MKIKKLISIVALVVSMNVNAATSDSMVVDKIQVAAGEFHVISLTNNWGTIPSGTANCTSSVIGRGIIAPTTLGFKELVTVASIAFASGKKISFSGPVCVPNTSWLYIDSIIVE